MLAFMAIKEWNTTVATTRSTNTTFATSRNTTTTFATSRSTTTTFNTSKSTTTTFATTRSTTTTFNTSKSTTTTFSTSRSTTTTFNTTRSTNTSRTTSFNTSRSTTTTFNTSKSTTTTFNTSKSTTTTFNTTKSTTTTFNTSYTTTFTTTFTTSFNTSFSTTGVTSLRYPATGEYYTETLGRWYNDPPAAMNPRRSGVASDQGLNYTGSYQTHMTTAFSSSYNAANIAHGKGYWGSYYGGVFITSYTNVQLWGLFASSQSAPVDYNSSAKNTDQAPNGTRDFTVTNNSNFINVNNFSNYSPNAVQLYDALTSSSYLGLPLWTTTLQNGVRYGTPSSADANLTIPGSTNSLSGLRNNNTTYQSHLQRSQITGDATYSVLAPPAAQQNNNGWQTMNNNIGTFMRIEGTVRRYTTYSSPYTF